MPGPEPCMPSTTAATGSSPSTRPATNSARDASGPCNPPLTCPHRKRRWGSPLPCRQAPHIPVSLIPAKHQSGLEVTDPPPPEFRLAAHQGRFTLRAMVSRLEGGPCRTHSDPHVSRPCTCHDGACPICRRAGKAAQRSTRAGDDIQDTDLDIVLAMDDQVWEATNAPMPHSSSA